MWLLWAGLAAAAPFGFAPEDGAIGFHAVASLHEFDGAAAQFTANFDPVTKKGAIHLPVKALSTGIGARDSRMIYTCLDAVTFPEVSFVIESVDDETGILAKGQGQAGVTLHGTLRVRDVDQDFVIPADAHWEGGNLRMRGSFPVFWADFGIPDPSILISTLRPDVSVRFDLLGRPQ